MKLFTIGLNHRTTPLEWREQFSLPEANRPVLMRKLHEEAGLKEVVVLNTCNRLEIYGVQEAGPVPVDTLMALVRSFATQSANRLQAVDISQFLYVHEGLDCVRHLFRVASSLDSLVVGETEIVGQVKKAYQMAQSGGVTGAVLNRLFQKALGLSKKVRTRSGIGRCSTSVGAVSVDLAEQIFGEDLADRTVLIIGAGKMGETTLKHLAKRGAKSILVANRSLNKAVDLASEFLGQPVPLEALPEVLPQADVVISSTGAPHYILSKNDVAQALTKRENRPIFLIDLAVPRNIDPAVQELSFTYLYNIDQLAELAQQNLQKRQMEAQVCETLVAEHAEEYFDRDFSRRQVRSEKEPLLLLATSPAH